MSQPTMLEGKTDKTALADIPDHNGQPRRASAWLFTPPPKEIGRIITASTTADTDKTPWAMSARVRLAAGVAIFIVLLFALISALMAQRDFEQQVTYALGFITGAIGFLVTMLATGYKAICSYVGERGVARFTQTGSPHAAPKEERFLFEHAAELHSQQVRQYVNGIYMGTNYSYKWSDAAGAKVFLLGGTHYRGKKAPKPRDDWHFANSAELSWSEHYLAIAADELERLGYIEFAIDRKRRLRVAPGFIEFHFGAEPTRVEQAEIASASIADGYFSFKHKDARWYSTAGKYRFAYGTMANAKVFLLALEKLMGITWE